ncbi:hypothetical protein K7X08_028736 [Anisodus acutangulus]|uniref:Uncharacterized protein n=1 Tax=Anisodus acutangulus TaxID=402998 RepID=A0A9Q1L2Y6_9SOLA|nr:hypothetical protein K7X08_028736 [Anisodus acutangulus]
MRMLVDDSSAMTARPSSRDKGSGAIVSSSFNSQEQRRTGTSQTRNIDATAPANSQLVQWKDDNHGGSDSQDPNQPGKSKQGKDAFMHRLILIEFDRDDELFAIAGVSRRIKVFEFSSVVNEPAEAQCPVVEMSTRSKLSCLSWNKYTKNHLASSDYEGIVTVWDVPTRQSVMEYEEHENEHGVSTFAVLNLLCLCLVVMIARQIEMQNMFFSQIEEASVLTIDMKANICSVKYNPGFSAHVAVSSADHHIHYYDLRNINQPLHIFSGHRKAVLYVNFLSNHELGSASTDNTLRLWDVKENVPLRTFKGHTNEKNFVGLTVNNEYLACGSETNEVFVYHKAISKPAARHRSVSEDQNDPDGDMGSFFISAICWKCDSPTILTANSQGTIKALVLAA